MTSGNDPYLEHLRGQLTEVLDVVTPSAAPTAAVKRKGRAMRNRRRAGVAAGLAAAIVAAALVPGLLRQSGTQRPVTPKHKNPKVTVRTVGVDAPKGLIARGSIGGKPWRMTVSRQGNGLCVRSSGDLPQPGCAPSEYYGSGSPATLDGTGGGAVNALYGEVTAKVRRLSLALSDGTVLNLRPVSFGGHRWIGVELPAQLTVTRAVAYSPRGELSYAIPFTPARGGLPSFQTWLRPGEPAPREFVRQIASGVTAGKRWSVAIHAGPWGQCAVPAIPGDSGNIGCWTVASRQPGPTMGSGGWMVAAARPGTSYLVLTMTDGSTRRVRVVQVGKVPYYAIVTLNGPAIARWAAYDKLGHRLYGGQGAP